MDRKLVSAQEYELRYLAAKHGTSGEKIKEVIQSTGSRSREQIEVALDRHFQEVPFKPAKRARSERPE